MLIATQIYVYAGEKGLGHAFTRPLHPGLWFFALSTILTPMFLLLDVTGFLSAILAVILSLLWARFLSCKFGGLTGDNYGALNEVTEVLFFLFALSRFAG